MKSKKNLRKHTKKVKKKYNKQKKYRKKYIKNNTRKFNKKYSKKKLNKYFGGVDSLQEENSNIKIYACYANPNEILQLNKEKEYLSIHLPSAISASDITLEKFRVNILYYKPEIVLFSGHTEIFGTEHKIVLHPTPINSSENYSLHCSSEFINILSENPNLKLLIMFACHSKNIMTYIRKQQATDAEYLKNCAFITTEELVLDDGMIHFFKGCIDEIKENIETQLDDNIILNIFNRWCKKVIDAIPHETTDFANKYNFGNPLNPIQGLNRNIGNDSFYNTQFRQRLLYIGVPTLIYGKNINEQINPYGYIPQYCTSDKYKDKIELFKEYINNKRQFNSKISHIITIIKTPVTTDEITGKILVITEANKKIMLRKNTIQDLRQIIDNIKNIFPDQDGLPGELINEIEDLVKTIEDLVTKIKSD